MICQATHTPTAQQNNHPNQDIIQGWGNIKYPQSLLLYYYYYRPLYTLIAIELGPGRLLATFLCLLLLSLRPLMFECVFSINCVCITCRYVVFGFLLGFFDGLLQAFHVCIKSFHVIHSFHWHLVFSVSNLV